MSHSRITPALRHFLIQSIADLTIQLEKINRALAAAETAQKEKPEVTRHRSDAITAALFLGIPEKELQLELDISQETLRQWKQQHVATQQPTLPDRTTPWIAYNEQTKELIIDLDRMDLNRPKPGEPLRWAAQLAEPDQQIPVRLITVQSSNLPPPGRRTHRDSPI